MKQCLCFGLALALAFPLHAQVRWDGEGGDGQWTNPSNWLPDGVPPAGADILLDNSIVNIVYTITLPNGNAVTEANSIRITPAQGMIITLIIPPENIAIPALKLSGSGDALILDDGAVFRNKSGAVSGDPIQLMGNFRIADGGRYVHQTGRGNAALIDRLSSSEGTALGIFEFDVPGTAGYTVSLTGNTFGTLMFSAVAAGGIKSYSGSGASDLKIRGHLIIGTGANLTSTLSANILLSGNLEVHGNLHLNPSTQGSSGRSIVFTGDSGYIRGVGPMSLSANFRTLEFSTGSGYWLDRNIAVPLPQHIALLQSGAILHLQDHIIEGEGQFQMQQGATLGIGSPNGISSTENSGNILTSIRQFPSAASYLYEGLGHQFTGNGLPTAVSGLGVNKVSGTVSLSQTLGVTEKLGLWSGILESSPDAFLVLKDATIESPTNDYGQPNEGWSGSFVSGPIRWESSLQKTQVLPTGKGTTYAPVRVIREKSGFAAYTVTYHQNAFDPAAPLAPPLARVSTLEYWRFSSDPVGAAAEARIGISWRPGSGLGSGSQALTDLRLTQLEDRGAGLRWEMLGDNPVHAVEGNFGWLESNQAQTVFSEVTLASASNLNVLPLKQIDIRANQAGKAIEIIVGSNALPPCSCLMLERSAQGKNFFVVKSIRMVEAKKNQCVFVDSLPLSGWNYYRIRPTKMGLDSLISDIASLKLHPLQSPGIFPNPVLDWLTIYLPVKSSGLKAIIVHTNGRQVHLFILSGEKHKENLSFLPSGHYLLLINLPDQKLSLPFFKR